MDGRSLLDKILISFPSLNMPRNRAVYMERGERRKYREISPLYIDTPTELENEKMG